MRHWFITADGNLKTRWKKAFPDIAALTPDSLRSQVQPNDIVWLLTTVEEWSSLIDVATKQGAITVVMSYAADDREALKALDLGARGYVHTLAAPEVLKQVALVVANQGVWVGQALLAKVLGGSFKALQQRGERSTNHYSESLELLTEREMVVARAVAQGATNKEVARQLDITERTVKAHLSAIFRKLVVRDRLQLMLKLSTLTQ